MYDDNDCDDAMTRWCKWGWGRQDWIKKINDEAFIPSTRHCTRRRCAGHVRATSLPHGGTCLSRSENPIVRVLCHYTWPACAPLVSHASMHVSCVDIGPRFTQVSLLPFVCHMGPSHAWQSVSNQAATSTIRLQSILIVRSTMIAARILPADPCDLM